MNPCHKMSRRHHGFTLIEVMIALLLTGAGLLGIAKIQAMIISVTKDSGTRSLIATQVGSLASSMHANPAFWAAAGVPALVTASGTTVTDSTHTLDSGAVSDCTMACTPAKLASSDLANWVADMNNQFPGYTAKITCSTTVPVDCSVYVTWLEKMVAINQTTATGPSNQVSAESFSVYVKP